MPLDAMYIKGEPPTTVGGVEVQRWKKEEDGKGGRETCRKDKPPHEEGQQPGKRIMTAGPKLSCKEAPRRRAKDGVMTPRKGCSGTKKLLA